MKPEFLYHLASVWLVANCLIIPSATGMNKAATQDAPADELQTREELSSAIWEGNIKQVEKLIPKLSDLDKSVDGLPPPIFEAVSAGEDAIVRLLVKAGASVHVREPEWNMPLLNEAAATGNEQLFDYLIAKGCKINLTDKHGGNAVEEAAFNGHRTIARRLLSMGLKTKFRLHVVAGVGTTKEIETELSKTKADIDEPTGWKNTPLFFAISNSNSKAVQLLIQRGANPNARNIFGCTPLHYAASLDRAAVVTMLLKAGADSNAKNDSEESPKDWASDPKIIQLLSNPSGA